MADLNDILEALNDFRQDIERGEVDRDEFDTRAQSILDRGQADLNLDFSQEIQDLRDLSRIDIDLSGILDELRQLDRLARTGAISEAEFATRARAIQRTPVAQQEDPLTDDQGNLVNLAGRFILDPRDAINPLQAIQEELDGIRERAGFAEETLNDTFDDIDLSDAAREFFFFSEALSTITGALGGIISPFQNALTLSQTFNQQLIETQILLISNSKIINEAGDEIFLFGEKVEATQGKLRELSENLEIATQSIAGLTSARLANVTREVTKNIALIQNQSQVTLDTFETIESLVPSIAAALSTLDLPEFQDTQEIRALLRGEFTNQDAILAQQLGITKQQAELARAQGRFVDLLSERLQPFVEGNRLASQQLDAVLVNFQDTIEILARGLGDNLLPPLTKAASDLFVAFSEGRQALDLRTERAELLGVIQATNTLVDLRGELAERTAAGTISEGQIDELRRLIGAQEDLLEQNQRAIQERNRLTGERRGVDRAGRITGDTAQARIEEIGGELEELPAAPIEQLAIFFDRVGVEAKVALTEIIDALKEIGRTLDALGIFSLLESVGDLIISIIRAVSTLAQGVSGAFSLINSLITGTASSINETGSAISNVTDFISNLLKDIGNFGRFIFNSITEPITGIIKRFSELNRVASAIVNLGEGFLKGGIAAFLINTFPSALKAITQGIGGILSTTPLIGSFFNFISTRLTSILQGLQGLIGIIPGLGPILNKAISSLSPKNIVPFIGQIVVLAEGVGALQGALDDLFGSTGKIEEGFDGAIKGFELLDLTAQQLIGTLKDLEDQELATDQQDQLESLIGQQLRDTKAFIEQIEAELSGEVEGSALQFLDQEQRAALVKQREVAEATLDQLKSQAAELGLSIREIEVDVKDLPEIGKLGVAAVEQFNNALRSVRKPLATNSQALDEAFSSLLTFADQIRETGAGEGILSQARLDIFDLINDEAVATKLSIDSRLAGLAKVLELEEFINNEAQEEIDRARQLSELRIATGQTTLTIAEEQGRIANQNISTLEAQLQRTNQTIALLEDFAGRNILPDLGELEDARAEAERIQLELSEARQERDAIEVRDRIEQNENLFRIQTAQARTLSNLAAIRAAEEGRFFDVRQNALESQLSLAQLEANISNRRVEDLKAEISITKDLNELRRLDAELADAQEQATARTLSVLQEQRDIIEQEVALQLERVRTDQSLDILEDERDLRDGLISQARLELNQITRSVQEAQKEVDLRQEAVDSQKEGVNTLELESNLNQAKVRLLQAQRQQLEAQIAVQVDLLRFQEVSQEQGIRTLNQLQSLLTVIDQTSVQRTQEIATDAANDLSQAQQLLNQLEQGGLDPEERRKLLDELREANPFAFNRAREGRLREAAEILTREQEKVAMLQQDAAKEESEAARLRLEVEERIEKLRLRSTLRELQVERLRAQNIQDSVERELVESGLAEQERLVNLQLQALESPESVSLREFDRLLAQTPDFENQARQIQAQRARERAQSGDLSRFLGGAFDANEERFQESISRLFGADNTVQVGDIDFQGENAQVLRDAVNEAVVLDNNQQLTDINSVTQRIESAVQQLNALTQQGLQQTDRIEVNVNNTVQDPLLNTRVLRGE